VRSAVVMARVALRTSTSLGEAHGSTPQMSG
jgi:hypothetical protein